MRAMRQVIRRMPRSHQSGTTVRHARGVIGVRRVWAHECGAEAVEALALVAVLIALLALLSLVMRDRAAAIGAAATATLAGWLTGAPGVTPLTVTAPLYTVVSLPQLLVQTTDAAPWVTWGIGIAGSLLSAAAAWQTTTSRALSADAGAWFRPVGAALDWLVRQGARLVSRALPADAGAWLRPVGAAVDWLIRQGAGLVIGFCEGVVDTIAGLVTLVVDVVKLIAGDEATRRTYGALLEALARDPLGTLAGIFEAIIAPIKTDWQAGRYGEAIGRAVFELLPAILAIVTGGGSAAGYAAKAGNAGKAADALADAGRIVSHVDDVGRIVERVDDAARGVDALADTGRTAGTAAGKAASHADDAADLARSATRISENLAQEAAQRTLPLGFRNADKFAQFGARLKQGLQNAGYGDVQAAFRGSSVTGVSFKTGAPFDVGRVSDFDLALASSTLLQRAKKLGIGLRGGGTRTEPLDEEHLKMLGLLDLSRELGEMTGRPVTFMIYESIESIAQRGPYIIVR
jgi:hypothetical protein